MIYSTRLTSCLCLLALAAMLLLVPQSARAGAQEDTQQCTTFTERAAIMAASTTPTDGLLSNIYGFITKTVNTSTQKLFEAFTKNDSYRNAVYWAMVLMVIFYGIGFTIGIVQPSFQQVLIRLVKMSIVMALISPTGWQFFSGSGNSTDSLNVVSFFNDGTDDLIKGIQAAGTGIPVPDGATPFYALDRLADFIIQPDTLIAIMGSMFAGGPFGFTMSGLMIIAMWGFVMLVLRTLRVYAITYVARALVLGVAPIFFVFLLFDKTKNMFIAWLNALINLSLQPILLFTFLSFFLVMIESAATDMLHAELCWRDFTNLEGSPSSIAFWRYIDEGTGQAAAGESTWQGSLECLISPDRSTNNKCKEFPVNIIDLLSFLILVYVAQRFTEVVERISSELSNALVALDNAGRLDQMLANQNQKGLSGGSINPQASGQLPKKGK